MGQIFSACAYDIKTKACCVVDSDKFHANCYSFSDTVATMHFLLRLKSWRIMWGGNYVCTNLAKFSRDEDLQGISTYVDIGYFERNDDNLKEKEGYDKVKLIVAYHKMWEHIDVWNVVCKYFDLENTKSVKYDGFLVNHTQKTAVDLADFYRQSVSLTDDGRNFVIDLLPVLTETGEGTQMALYEGLSFDSTEELAGTWCGDELQIVDDLPENYRPINCCFAEIWSRAYYCYDAFGLNQEGYLLNDSNQNLYEVTRLNLIGKRGSPRILKVEKTDGRIKFSAKALPETKTNEANEVSGQNMPLAIAESMLKMGMAVEDVIKMTGMSEEQLKSLNL